MIVVISTDAIWLVRQPRSYKAIFYIGRQQRELDFTSLRAVLIYGGEKREQMGRRLLRVGRVSVATRQLVQVQLGRPQLNGDSLRQRGRLNGYINVLLFK
jgi:hypothetical protein